MHSNIHHTINATEQTTRKDGHTLWHAHFRKLFALLFLMMASVGAWAQTNANYVPFEFYTSINQITGNFAIVNAAEGKALYGPDAQNIGYADYATAFANNRAVTQYALENAGNGNYRLRCVTPAGGNYGLWGSNPCYLNAQPAIGGVLFNLGLNNQNGQDIRNGALWKLNYVEGNGWTIQNVAHNGYAAPNNTTRTQPYYWQLCSLADNSFANNNYVFYSGGNNGEYLGTSTDGTTTFNPSTCIWTGNNNGTFHNGNNNYLRNNNTWFLNSASNASNCILGGTENGTTGQTIRMGTNGTAYYLLYYNNQWVRWTTGSTVVFKVTRNILSTQITAPTLSGADQIAQLGNTTYTRTNAAYQPACYDYVFYNGAHHYCTSVTANATATRPSETFTYIWSLLNEDGTPYTGANVSVNNSGVVNYQSFFSSDTRLILRLTASSASKTFTADKTITFDSKQPTTLSFNNVAPTISADGWSIVLPPVTLMSGETTVTGRTITYSGTNCSVNNNGVVNNINGTATITATFAGDDTYAPSSTTYTITTTEHQALNETIVGDITITPATATLDLGGTQDYSVPASVTAMTRTCDQYTEYSFPVGTAYRYAGSGWQYTLTAPTITENPNATVNLTQVSWGFSGGAGNYYTPSTYYSTTSNVVTLTRTAEGVTSTQEYTITATAVYGSVNKMATAKVVIPAPILDLSGITANPASYSIAVNETADITCTYTINGVGQPYVDLVYSGYDNNIISVDANGRITGLAEGNTTVTIQSKKQDGSNGPRTTVSVEVANGNGTQANPYRISSVSGLEKINNNKDKYFIVTADFDASSFDTEITGFSGTLDGGYHTISGLTTPLFVSLNGATIKNVILDNVTISDARTVNGTNCLGAIACYAAGSTKIYNCGVQASGSTFDKKGNPVNGSSTISGGDNTGSLVGYITGNTRVVNNYSYANVSGGERASGIVGRVAGTALTKDNYTDGNHCAVVCNMFYGDLSGTSNVSPVYAGNHTSNVQNVNEYNYWRSRANVSYNSYNNQLAVDKNEFLSRFPFYRHILNTHRELAAIYLFGSRTDANVAEIGHWYNTKNKPDGEGGIDNPTPYPIIEVWKTNTKRTTEDIKNNLPNTGNQYEGNLITSADRSGKTVGTNGYLRVNASINDNSFSVDLPITDMDSLNYDFTWGKVVLPFANEFSGWTRDYSRICTGWKITGFKGGTAGSLTNYDFANRDCTAKDLYTNSGYIFAQGGNYIVPYGVTEINIEANFARAYYLRDGSYDIGYDVSYGGATAIAGNITGQYHGQNVYTNLGTLLDAMGTATDPHQQAIVLVGNFHYNQNALGGNIFGSRTTKGLTIMSVDEDNNQEPDYGWYSYHTTDRTDIAPVRFDFVPNIGIGMAARTTGSTPYPTIGIWHGHGWFELTETCVSFMSECEINSYSFNATDNSKGNNRWIANSGYFIQIVRARDGNCTKLSYIQIGGNAYVEQLYPGSHTDNARNVTIRPIIVNGGEIEECYMTGYKAGATASGSDIYFWSAGGKMHKWLAAYVENPNTDGVNVTAKIDHAIINRFFGGGTSTSARIKGDIDVTMNNSFVNFYCGGPEFGDMNSGKTVTTHAKGTTFGEYYGGGFGGTSITINREEQNAGVGFGNNATYPLGFGNYTNNRLQNGTYGIGVNYDFEYIFYSGGTGTGVARFYTGYANYSLAQTGSVTNVLEDCTVLRNYFGGGCQGKVAGTVTSTLTNCDVKGSAFGGGYKPAETTVDVYPTTQPTYSRYTKETGLFSDFGTVTPETFTWKQRNTAGSNETNRELYTTVNMSESGLVTGSITITVNGGKVGQNVFGGGNESPSQKCATVTVENKCEVGGTVFGGGNSAPIGVSTKVTVDDSHVKGDVFGGGLGLPAVVTGNTTVWIKGIDCFIEKSVLGGGFGADVSGDTHVQIGGESLKTEYETTDCNNN